MPRQSTWPVTAFLTGYTVLLMAVSHYYLLPALDAYAHADREHKKLLAAHATLLMCTLLVILLLGLILTFRVGRFFRLGGKPTPTKYTDAWAESGKRLPPT